MLREHDADPAVVEFNCRFGDPEAEAILAATPEGLLPVLRLVAEGGWMPAGMRLGAAIRAAVTTVIAARGYPSAPETGAAIRIPEDVEGSADVLVFHAGTAVDGAGQLRVSGGRVLAVTAVGPNVATAAARSRAAAGAIQFDGKQYRRDIGWREVARSRESAIGNRESGSAAR
jgi:phosphoribosylamine--glycine ligase